MFHPSNLLLLTLPFSLLLYVIYIFIHLLFYIFFIIKFITLLITIKIRMHILIISMIICALMWCTKLWVRMGRYRRRAVVGLCLMVRQKATLDILRILISQKHRQMHPKFQLGQLILPHNVNIKQNMIDNNNIILPWISIKNINLNSMPNLMNINISTLPNIFLLHYLLDNLILFIHCYNTLQMFYYLFNIFICVGTCIWIGVYVLGTSWIMLLGVKD